MHVSNDTMFLNASQFESRFHQVDWIVPMAIHAILIFATAWIFLALILYGRRTKMWCTDKTCKSEKMNTGLIYSSVIGCGFVCLVFYAVNITYINVGFEKGKNEVCDSLSDCATTIYCLGLLSVFTFLWLRQRAFYNNFLLNLEYSKCLRVLSTLSIFLILIPGTAFVAFTTWPNDHESSDLGCLYKPHDEFREAYWISAIFLIVFGQSTLVGLFVYALKKTSGEGLTSGCFGCCSCKRNVGTSLPRKKNGNPIRSVSYSSSGTDGNSFSRSFSTSSLAQEDQSRAVQRILWKTLIFGILSMIIDILVQVVIFFLVNPHQHRRISATVCAVSTLLNLSFLVLSFVSFKEILKSPWIFIRSNWCRRPEDEMESDA